MLWHHTSSTLEDWDTHSASCSEVWQLTALHWVALAQGHITAQRKLTLKDWLMVETAKAWLLCSKPRQLWKAIPAPRLLNKRSSVTTSWLNNSSSSEEDSQEALIPNTFPTCTPPHRLCFFWNRSSQQLFRCFAYDSCSPGFHILCFSVAKLP